MNVHPARRLLPLIFLVPTAVGCGVEEYESRIVDGSVPFFRYQNAISSELGKLWSVEELAIRMPARLQEMPVLKKKADAAPTRDARLPPWYAGEIPGLIGGFRGTMKGDKASGGTADVPVFAYVVSNRGLLNSKNADAKHKQFARDLLSAVGTGIGFGPIDEKSLRAYPLRGRDDYKRFEPQVGYDFASADVKNAGPLPLECRVYVRRRTGDGLVPAVVFFVPKNAAREERLQDRIDLALQTFAVTGGSGAAIGSPTPGGGGGGGPAF